MSPRNDTTTALLVAGLVFVPAAVAAAQQAREEIDTTGSHLGSTAGKIAVIQMSGDSEIDRILALIEAGDDQAALERARAYVDHLDVVRPADETLPADRRYHALNALCIALTRTRDLDEAVATCTDAVDLAPGRWTALNSRGTAHFAAGRYADALVDYREARQRVTDNDPAVPTIEHNIALTEARIAENR